MVKSSPAMQIHTVTSRMFAENCYIAHIPGRTDCLVIDPGFEPQGILDLLHREGLRPAAILNTHGHADHIAGNAALKEAFPEAPLLIGQKDAIKLTSAAENLSEGYGIPVTSPPADRLLQHGESLELAGLALEVRDAPGHSSGHIVLVWHDPQQPLIFGGDVLFAGSVGRTDLPGGSMEHLICSIHEQLFTLSDQSIVLPGHGPPTKIGVEKRTNPYCALDQGSA